MGRDEARKLGRLDKVEWEVASRDFLPSQAVLGR